MNACTNYASHGDRSHRRLAQLMHHCIGRLARLTKRQRNVWLPSRKRRIPDTWLAKLEVAERPRIV
jgi:hypothetical protein